MLKSLAEHASHILRCAMPQVNARAEQTVFNSTASRVCILAYLKIQDQT